LNFKNLKHSTAKNGNSETESNGMEISGGIFSIISVYLARFSSFPEIAVPFVTVNFKAEFLAD